MPIEPSIKIVNNPYIQSFLFKQYDDNEKDWIEVNKKSKLKKKEIKEGGFCKNIEEIVKIIEEEFENSQNPICIYFRGFEKEYVILKEVCKKYNKIFLEEPQKYLPEINQTIEKMESLFKEIQNLLVQMNAGENENTDNIFCGELEKYLSEISSLKKGIYSDEKSNLYWKYLQCISDISYILSEKEKKEQQRLERYKEVVESLEVHISYSWKNVTLFNKSDLLKKRSIKEKFLDVAKDIPDFTKELFGIGYKKERNQIPDKSISERIVDVVKDIPDFTKELLGIGYKKSTNSEIIELDMDEKKDNTPERNLEELKKSKEEWENKCRILEDEIEHLNSLIAKAQDLKKDLELA